jgi:uncharacterized protein (TIGR02452 family)
MRIVNYFARKNELAKKAKAHTREMSLDYSEEIDSAINRSVIYGPEMPNHTDIEKDYETVVSLNPATHQWYIENSDFGDDDIVCVHNFASYKNPGGMFIQGSSAQEESLCHASNLYNILSGLPEFYSWNMENKNKGMYMDRAIYTPDVIFKYEDEHTVTTINIDVLTCAAPNASVMKKYGAFSKEENFAALERRISFVAEILNDRKVDVFITGAWGCGVFAQDPETVAMLMYKYLSQTCIKELQFVIPRGHQFETFHKVLKPYL